MFLYIVIVQISQIKQTNALDIIEDHKKERNANWISMTLVCILKITKMLTCLYEHKKYSTIGRIDNRYLIIFIFVVDSLLFN
jgi:hypothetical protein